MFRQNLLIIYRSFKRFRSTFIINLLGLSTGLASALLIYLWVNDELRMDKFHEKDRRLYQVMESHKQADGWNTMIETSGAAADALAAEMPEVEYAAALAPPIWPGFDRFVLSTGDRNIRATGQYAGKEYFNIFSYKLTEGHADQVLADKNSIVISEDIAMKLFNRKHNVVGKTIGFQHEREFIVSGVFENIPAASSTQFDFVLSFETFQEMKPWAGEWNSSGPHVYLVLREERISRRSMKRYGISVRREQKAILRTEGHLSHRTPASISMENMRTAFSQEAGSGMSDCSRSSRSLS